MSVEVFFNTALKAHNAGSDLSFLSPALAESVRAYHTTFSEYRPTPLVSLPALAKKLGLKNMLVKDESQRFGLNAFKVLGGSYAMARYLAGRLGLDEKALSRAAVSSPEAKARAGDITFITTTDGNHGRGVAWTARELGYRCIVRMPKGSEEVRVNNIRAEGADCTVTDLNYDDTVRMTWDMAQKNGYVMMQDTAWQGYEEIPTWIMQGYMTLALEALEAMRAADTMPTHCFLQSGVGSFPGAVVGCLVAALGKDAPNFIIVEPHQANCIYMSAKAGDGKPHKVSGDLHSIMAGLACGEPNTVSWPLLRDYSTAFVSCPDYIAANGMRMLAAPLPGDRPLVSGESGAVSTGLVQWFMQHPDAEAQRQKLGLGPDSTVFCISTEGDTAPHVYRNIVWFGACPDTSLL